LDIIGYLIGYKKWVVVVPRKKAILMHASDGQAFLGTELMGLASSQLTWLFCTAVKTY
jgi:hypothetical protein